MSKKKMKKKALTRQGLNVEQLKHVCDMMSTSGKAAAGLFSLPPLANLLASMCKGSSFGESLLLLDTTLILLGVFVWLFLELWVLYLKKDC